MSSAEIAGRVSFDRNFSAIGGVSLYQTNIRDIILIDGSRFESIHPNIPAIDGQELKISGSILWSNESNGKSIENKYNWHVAGCVSFVRARISGDIILKGCRWAHIDSKSPFSGKHVAHIVGGIDLRLSQIDGQLDIREGCFIARRDRAPSRKSDADIRRIFLVHH